MGLISKYKSSLYKTNFKCIPVKAEIENKFENKQLSRKNKYLYEMKYYLLKRVTKPGF